MWKKKRDEARGKNYFQPLKNKIIVLT